MVRAAHPEPVAEATPAGLPRELLQSVVFAYSELSSRRAAMESFSYARAGGEVQGRDLLGELGNDHEAAERFDADLASARALAAS